LDGGLIADQAPSWLLKIGWTPCNAGFCAVAGDANIVARANIAAMPSDLAVNDADPKRLAEG
jgi:hypothetical protein